MLLELRPAGSGHGHASGVLGKFRNGEKLVVMNTKELSASRTKAIKFTHSTPFDGKNSISFGLVISTASFTRGFMVSIA